MSDIKDLLKKQENNEPLSFEELKRIAIEVLNMPEDLANLYASEEYKDSENDGIKSIV